MVFETKITEIKKVKDGIAVIVTAGDYKQETVFSINDITEANIRQFAELVKSTKQRQIDTKNLDMTSVEMKSILSLKGKKLEEL